MSTPQSGRTKVDAIRTKWMAVKGKPVDISFPKGADKDVMRCIVDAASGDVYDLLSFIDDVIDGKDRIIYDARDQVKSVIEHMPMDCQIYVREGASDENVYASLAVSVAKLTGQLRAVQADLRELRMEKEGIAEQDIAETMPPKQGEA